jgi:hypothetical protein
MLCAFCGEGDKGARAGYSPHLDRALPRAQGEARRVLPGEVLLLERREVRLGDVWRYRIGSPDWSPLHPLEVQAALREEAPTRPWSGPTVYSKLRFTPGTPGNGGCYEVRDQILPPVPPVEATRNRKYRGYRG